MPNSLKLLQLFFLFVFLPPFAPKFEILDDSFEHTWMESFLLSLSVPLVPHGVLLHHEFDWMLMDSPHHHRSLQILLVGSVFLFIHHYINVVDNFSKPFIVTFVCFAVSRITKENAFICFRFKLSKIFIIIFNIAFASKKF